jgi:CheY-like chemotaxis protein
MPIGRKAIMSSDTDKKYCLCCGEDVPCNTVVRNGQKALTCMYCGFILDIENIEKKKEVPEMTYALIAEDSTFARKLLKDLVSRAKLTSEVIAVTNGLELIMEFKKLRQNKAKISFSIIDLSMPVMDGLTAASVLRYLEENDVKIPIVFFSAVKSDEELKKQMELLAPAFYLNKGSEPDPRNLADRIYVLLNFISHYYQTA